MAQVEHEIRQPTPNQQVAVQVAKEMNNLSATEREKVLDDVHGTSKVDGLSEEAILQKMESLQKCLDGLRTFSAVYDLALRTNASYVTDPEFRMVFLRASGWDPAKAAARLVQFLEEKHKLFCKDKPELLCQDISQHDLDVETLQLLYGDFVVELLVGDMAGRVVDLIRPAKAIQFSTQCKVRSYSGYGIDGKIAFSFLLLEQRLKLVDLF